MAFSRFGCSYIKETTLAFTKASGTTFGEPTRKYRIATSLVELVISVNADTSLSLGLLAIALVEAILTSR